MPGPGNRLQIAERNLIFAGLGMQLGILSREKIIRAFTEWLLDKKTPLGEILVQQNAITAEQRRILDEATETQIRQDGNEESALASIKQVKDLESDLEHLDDSDIQQSVRLTHSTRLVPNPTSRAFEEMSLGDSIGSPAAVFHPPPGDPSDRFEPTHFFDAGSLGELYFARDKELNRTVVVKFIKPEQAQNPLNRALFHLEGEVTGYLEHPNITPVYGLGKDSRDRSYYAMRYIRGRKLTRAIAEYHNIPATERGHRQETLIGLLQGFQSACLAVEYAHTRGVIHCDIKPDNIMVGEFGEIMVVDWGLVVVKDLARPKFFANPEETQDRFAEMSTFAPSRSASGGLHEKQGGGRNYVGGTPAYMAPEQMRASETGDIELLTAASDVFGLGATLYHLLVGKAPLLPDKDRKESKSAYYQRIEKAHFPRPRQIKPEISTPLEAIVLKAMSLDPTRRYSSARELADDLRLWLADEPVSAYRETTLEKTRRWMRKNRLAVGIGSVLLLCLSLGGVVFGGITKRFNDELRQSESDARDSAREANEQKLRAEESEKKARREEKAAQDQKALAEFNEKLAKSQREIAETQLYVNQIQRALAEWESGDDGIARSLMESSPWDKRGWEHDFLATRMDQDQVAFRGHQGIVTSVAFSPDGKSILSGGADNLAILWDTTTGRELTVLRGHAPRTVNMAFRREALFNIREMVTLKALPLSKELMLLKERSSRVNAVAFQPDGRLIATGADDKAIKLWDPATGKETRTLMGHMGEVLALAFSPDGKRLVSAGEDKLIKVWDLELGKEALTWKGHDERVCALAYDPRGRWLVSGSDDGTAKVWNAATGKLMTQLRGHGFYVTSVAISPDGNRIATGSLDKTVKVWDAASGTEWKTLVGHASGINAVAFSQDGTRLASASDDNTIKVWDPSSGQELDTLKGAGRPVTSLAFSPGGARLASGCENHSMVLWNSSKTRFRGSFPGHKGPVLCLGSSPNGRLVATGGMDRLAKIWEAETGKLLFQIGPFGDRVSTLTFDPSSRKLALGSWDNSVRIIDTQTGQIARRLPNQSHPVTSLAFSPDGSKLVTATLGGPRKVWDSETGKELLSLQGPRVFTTSVAYSPDRKWIASAGWDKIIRLCDADSGAEKGTIRAHADRITQITFSPDGKHLASAGDDKLARVWEVETGKEITQFRGHTGSVTALAFSPDGKRIASAGEGKQIRVWDPAQGRELLGLKGHQDRISGLCFSGDGLRLYSCGYDKQALVWDGHDKSEEMVIKNQGARLLTIGLSRDGQIVVARGLDRSLRAWNARTGEEIPGLPVEEKMAAINQGTKSPDGSWVVELRQDEIHVINQSLRGRRLERDRQRLQSWSVDDQ